MHPTQHSTHTRSKPRNAEELLLRTTEGLQRLAFQKVNSETHALNIEPHHAPLLRAAAAQSAPFRVRLPQSSTGEAA